MMSDSKLSEFDINYIIIGEDYAIRQSAVDIAHGDLRYGCVPVARDLSRDSAVDILEMAHAIRKLRVSRVHNDSDVVRENSHMNIIEKFSNINFNPRVVLDRLPEDVVKVQVSAQGSPKSQINGLENGGIGLRSPRSICEIPKLGDPKSTPEERHAQYYEFLKSNTDLKCPICYKVFDFMHKVKRHVRDVHLKIKKCKCLKCQNITTPEQCIKHVKCKRRNIKKTYSCPTCAVNFNRMKDFKDHMSTEHNETTNTFEEIFSCPICFEQFTFKHDLKNHLHTAHGVILDAENDNMYASTVQEVVVDPAVNTVNSPAYYATATHPVIVGNIAQTHNFAPYLSAGYQNSFQGSFVQSVGNNPPFPPNATPMPRLQMNGYVNDSGVSPNVVVIPRDFIYNNRSASNVIVGPQMPHGPVIEILDIADRNRVNEATVHIADRMPSDSLSRIAVDSENREADEFAIDISNSVEITSDSIIALTLDDISIALQKIDSGLAIFDRSDPNRERSTQVRHHVNNAVRCYRDVERRLFQTRE